MMLPIVPGLQYNAWRNMSGTGRWSTVKNLEKQLATQENRPAATVLPMPQGMRRLDQNGQPHVFGLYDEHNSAIYIEPNLVADSQPYRAVETLLHEARHAYQAYAVANPGFHNDPQQAEDWRVNNAPNVYYGGPDYSVYRWQPVEDDAAKIARARTNELYEGQLENQPGYAEYKAKREQEMAWDRQQAETTFGTDQVEEEGRLATYERHAQSLTQQVGQQAAQGEASNPEIPPSGTSPPRNGIEQDATQHERSAEPQTFMTQQEAKEVEVAETQQQETVAKAVEERQQTVVAETPETLETQQQRIITAESVKGQQQESAVAETAEAQQTVHTQETTKAPSAEAVQQTTAQPQQDAEAQSAVEPQLGQSAVQNPAESTIPEIDTSDVESEGYDYGYGY